MLLNYKKKIFIVVDVDRLFLKIENTILKKFSCTSLGLLQRKEVFCLLTSPPPKKKKLGDVLL